MQLKTALCALIQAQSNLDLWGFQVHSMFFVFSSTDLHTYDRPPPPKCHTIHTVATYPAPGVTVANGLCVHTQASSIDYL
jgi:hypothetical protein